MTLVFQRLVFQRCIERRCLGFWTLKTRIPDSTSKNFSDSGIRIPLHALRQKHVMPCFFLFVQANILLAAKSCVIPLGIESGYLPDDALSVSSYYDARYYPPFSRLNNIYQKGNDGSWCAKSNDGNQWLQVNFGRETTVTKVATQGRNNGAEWVISYSLSYSTDGIHWASYTLMDGHIKVYQQSNCCLNIKHNGSILSIS